MLTPVKQRLFLFFIVWLHVTVLDLFFVTHAGPVFMWAESTEFATLLVHLLTATTVTLTFIGLERFRNDYRQGKYAVRESIFMFLSIAMIFGIGFLLID